MHSYLLALRHLPVHEAVFQHLKRSSERSDVTEVHQNITWNIFRREGVGRTSKIAESDLSRLKDH